MDDMTREKIRWLEAERDRNLRLRCKLVAAKFQRMIDEEFRMAEKTEGNGHEDGGRTGGKV